jgi:hypothetical protein
VLDGDGSLGLRKKRVKYKEKVYLYLRRRVSIVTASRTFAEYVLGIMFGLGVKAHIVIDRQKKRTNLYYRVYAEDPHALPLLKSLYSSGCSFFLQRKYKKYRQIA